MKRALWKNGDWLFATLEEPCPNCEADGLPAGRDLDLDYETPGQALDAFRDVKDDAAAELLLNHAKQYYKDVIDSQGVARDKSKLLLGATSFTFAVFSGGAALLRESFGSAPAWLSVPMAVLFALIAIHFGRALVHALEAITREVTYAVSTQDYLAAIATPGSRLANAKRRLAADYRSAATRTNQALGHRKNSIMLAQSCFKWGFILVPVLVFVSLVSTYLTPKEQVPAWAQSLSEDVEDAKGALAALESGVGLLGQQLASVDDADLDGRVRDMEQHHLSAMQEMRDLGAALDQTRDDDRELRSLVQSLTDRMRAIDEQIEEINRRLQGVADAGMRAPEEGKEPE